MRILGLDPGLATLGFALVDVVAPAPPQLFDYGVIQTAKHHPPGDRLHTIFEDLHQVVARDRPDCVAIEKLFFYRMGNLVAVAQARGVMLLVLHQRQLSLQEFSPPEIKQALTGRGNASKHEVRAAVMREFGLTRPPQPDDAADAIAIALTGCFHHHAIA